MSKKNQLYRNCLRDSVTATAQQIIEQHKGAFDKNHKVCSLPIKHENAVRIATHLFKKKALF
jgi:ABC-type sugar transport system ATPase subunit